MPGRGCRGASAGHVVRAVEAAGDEVRVETLEFAVDEGQSRADNWSGLVSKGVNACLSVAHVPWLVFLIRSRASTQYRKFSMAWDVKSFVAWTCSRKTEAAMYTV